MHNKGIVKLLVTLLGRKHNPDLLMLVVSFLKKLSVFGENKDQMVNRQVWNSCSIYQKLWQLQKQENVVAKLAVLVAECKNEDLLNLTLRLLLNLSFDAEMRQMIAKCGMLPSLVQLIGHEYHHTPVLLLLYQISIEDQFKAMFTYTDCIPVVSFQCLTKPTFYLQAINELNQPFVR